MTLAARSAKSGAAAIDQPEARALERFLTAEFLHSLGCYTNAHRRAKLIKDVDLDCGEALKRTVKLNDELDRKRDKSKEDSRHPGPSKGKGLMLDDTGKERDRLQLITDFYNTGIIALKRTLDPDLKKAPDEDDTDGLLSLEKLGACLFWERDPGSAVFGVNGDFDLRQEELAKVRLRQEQGVGGKDGELPTTSRVKRRIEAKQARFVERKKAVEEALKPRLTFRRPWDSEQAGRVAQKLCSANLSTTKAPDRLTPGFVIECLVAGHLRLHSVEHFLSLPFKRAAAMNEVDREEALQSLREAEALHTFVYVVCWALPWLFAQNKGEMEKVLDGCVHGFGCGKEDREKELGNGSGEGAVVKESDPSVFSALWRAQRLAIFALHRRAFGHSLRDALVEETFNDTAFKDFHKLQRLLRVQLRGLPEPKGRDEGDREITPEAYIAGMDALAETHIGDLYRSDHAHPIALEHFCDAQDRLDQLSRELLLSQAQTSATDGSEAKDSVNGAEAAGEKPTEGPEAVADLLQDSRWRIHLMLSKGKGFYEAGKLKRSVKWLLKSWSALLVLVDFQEQAKRISKGKALPKAVDRRVFDELEDAIEALKKIRNDPDFSKAELVEKVEPVVKDAVRASIPPQLKVIAAEILLRLGHVFFVLRLDAGPEDDEHEEQAPDDEVDDLAYRCLDRANKLDPYSTLVAADRLKIEYKRKKEQGEDKKALFDPDRQWPFGRGNPDQIIRMIEYHLLWWLVMTELTKTADKTPDDPPQAQCSSGSGRKADRSLARELIAGLLTHTDSINVRQSQVYRFLMQPKRPAHRIGPAEGWEDPRLREPIGGRDGAAIEFVCLRRYSSFFPFVPRPSAFTSLGGGYLLRLHHQDNSCPQPFGIAVDPGPDFLENLYRCGFGLGDVNMIILTHDHPDHSVDLDPIFSLLGYRMKQGDPTFRAPSGKDEPVRRLLVVGNESVVSRLSFFNKPHASAPDASKPVRRDAVQVVSFGEFDAFREEINRIGETDRIPEVAIPDELRLKSVVSIRHLDSFGMLAYGFRLSLGDEGPSIGFTGDTGGFRLKRDEPTNSSEPPRWRIVPRDEHGTMKMTGDQTWREHWEDVLDADVLVPHVSGLPLSQLLVLANDGLSEFSNMDPELAKMLSDVWNGLEENVRKQVTFAFWLQEKDGFASLPLEEIDEDYKWPKGHLYLIGLLEFARAYRDERRRIGRPGLFLVGELREELGSLRGKIAKSLDRKVFQLGKADPNPEVERDCRALTADIGLRLMISREKGEARVRVLCSTCDLDNDRTSKERFHSPREIREVCVKGENEGMFYNCSNHDPSHHRNPVFLERVERYDVFAPVPIH